MKLRGIIACTLLTAACTGRPAEETVATPAPTVSTHLSHPYVTCFQQDSTGRIWIGTERGLNRYNGYDFHQYRHSSDSTTLPDSRIYDLCLDKENRLWVGTEDGVACFTDEEKFARYPIQSDEKAVQQVLCTRSGRLILNMQEDLCVYDSLSRSFENKVIGIDRFYSYHTRCYLDAEDLLWSVSPREIRLFETEGFANLDNFPTTHFVTASALLSDGQLWMSGGRRLSIFDTRTRRFLPVPATLLKELGQREIQLIFEIEKDRILFKASGTEILQYNRKEDSFSVFEPSKLGLPFGFDTQSLYSDRDGNLWLGSDEKGFGFFSPRSFSSGAIPQESHDGTSVVSMSLDPEGHLWVFTLHYGLVYYNQEKNDFLRPPIQGHPAGDRSDFLQTNLPLVLASSDGSLWLSFPNEQRLVRGRFRNGKVVLGEVYPAFYPRVALEDKEGGVWFGTRNENLVYMAPGARELERIQIFPYQTTFIHCLLQIGNDILIGAYNEPLTLLDIHTRQTRRLDILGGNANIESEGQLFYPTAFIQDSDGDIWIGTRYKGVLHYRQQDKTLNTVPGISSGDVFSLILDKSGRIWASTADGLAFYDTKEGRFIDYYPPHGIFTTSFYERSSVLMPSGELLFGGTNGVVVVNPEESSVKMSVKPVFEDVKVHNREVVPGKGIVDKGLSHRPRVVLPHGNNSFSISFSVPDFRNTLRLRYIYRLEGHDRDWVELGPSREVYFANLPAGRYTLRVRSYLEPDKGSFLENSLSVRVLPSPWMTVWAWMLYIALASGLIGLLWSSRRRLQRERAAALQAEQEKEQERKVNRMNMAFFSNISHEFRTPLTMISGPVSELSRKETLPEEDRRKLGIVQRSVNRMLGLVNQLMDFNKLENDSLGLQVIKADAVPVIRDCLEIFRLNSRSLGLTLDVSGLEYPLPMWLDEDKLQKILSNLLSNALKFTPKGGKVALEADEVSRDGARFLQVTVSDTGPGIPPDELERIFDRYYQLDNQKKGKHNYGTGIGLYYARRLATIHHGSLVAGNRDGGSGAVFTLLLPMAQDAYSEEERASTAHPVNGEYPLETVQAQEERQEAGSLPLLLAVDDDPDILHYLESLFAGGYRVISATGADEAFTLAQEQLPDVVLSDVAMPGKSGFDLCRELKSSLQLSHIPVILVTAMGTVQNQVQGLDLGADAYVTKPFDPAYLKALVRSQLENRHRLQSLVNAATESGEVDDLSSRDKAFLGELYALMDRELSNEDLDITQLTEMLKISRTKLYYKIKGLTGKTPSEFFMQYKLNVAAKLLREGKMNVSEIAFKTGFNTLPHFSKAFKKQFGVPPSKYEG